MRLTFVLLVVSVLVAAEAGAREAQWEKVNVSADSAEWYIDATSIEPTGPDMWRAWFKIVEAAPKEREDGLVLEKELHLTEFDCVGRRFRVLEKYEYFTGNQTDRTVKGSWLAVRPESSAEYLWKVVCAVQGN